MINKRLVSLLKDSIKYVKLTILWNFVALVMNIIFISTIAYLLENLLFGQISNNLLVTGFILVIISTLIRFYSQKKSVSSSYLASSGVKKTLREKIYQKLLSMGSSYQEKLSTAEVVQVAMEGVDQLEIYFGKYLPQLFYSLLAPVTLFILLSFLNFKSALVLLVCVPLIPVSIVAVQKFAKKLLSKYWGAYTNLGDSFLENLQGLTTLKIYQADKRKTEEMDKEAEHFRKITMKVLTMQLNSISVMDLVAYGGAAAGIVTAILEFQKGAVSFSGLLIIILLSSEFFIPLRLLGSFFHIAMNGMAASDKIFKILDTDTGVQKSEQNNLVNWMITMEHVDYSYETDRQILKNIDAIIHENNFVSFAGQSGCGKSTIAGILTGINKDYKGSVKIGDIELSDINEQQLNRIISLVNHNGYLFAGTVEYNLRMGKESATTDELWEVLKKVNLDQFIKEQGGLSLMLTEQAGNLSGGQKQRLVLARALLKNTPIYIFDEATSNIDVESENDIMEVISGLKKTKTVILISHRLENVRISDRIYMMEEGRIAESGTHQELYNNNGAYSILYKKQEALMQYSNSIPEGKAKSVLSAEVEQRSEGGGRDE